FAGPGIIVWQMRQEAAGAATSARSSKDAVGYTTAGATGLLTSAWFLRAAAEVLVSCSSGLGVVMQVYSASGSDLAASRTIGGNWVERPLGLWVLGPSASCSSRTTEPQSGQRVL